MTTEYILALTPGPEMDRAVHSQALGRPGRPKPYSTNLAAAATILEILPIFVSRISNKVEKYDEVKPFVGGLLTWHEGIKGFWSPVSVKCATIPLAICKAALLYTFQPRESVRAPQVPGPKFGTPSPPKELEPMPPRTLAPKLPEMPENEPPRPVAQPLQATHHLNPPPA